MTTNKELTAIKYSQALNRYASILLQVYNKTKDPIEKELTRQYYNDCLRIIPQLKFYDC